VATLPGIARLRPVDQFIVDSLTGLVQGEIDKGKVDTASLVDAANRISAVRTLAASADGFLRAGKIADAEAAYGQALAAIPEIAKSYAYFTGKAKDTETARQAALRAGLARAESAFAAGRYPEMLAAYREAFAYLPEPSARLVATLSNIGIGATTLAAQREQADQAQAAAPALTQANALLQQHKYADAAAQYLTVLQSYPRSAQASPSVKGINDSIAGLSAQSTSDLKGQTDQVAALNAQLASVQKDLSSRAGELTGIKKSLMNLVAMSGDPSGTPTADVMNAVNRKFGDLASAQGSSSDLTAQLRQAQANGRTLQKQIDTLSAENERLKATPQTASLRSAGAGSPAAVGVSSADAKALAEFEGLVAGYIAYTRQEDANLGQYGQQKALMLSVGTRDSFIASLGRYFDGILGRVKRYEQQSSTDGIDTGRKGALDDVISLMTGLANQKSADAQKSFLDARLAAEKDPRMKNVLGYLQRIVTSR
jgi:tetratricopeptide (TPR) repeat protein